jgi:hypothetical protein
VGVSRIGVAEMGGALVAELYKLQRILNYIYLFAASSHLTLISFVLLAFYSLACIIDYPRPTELLPNFWMPRIHKSVANYMEIYSLLV